MNSSSGKLSSVDCAYLERIKELKECNSQEDCLLVCNSECIAVEAEKKEKKRILSHENEKICNRLNKVLREISITLRW
jgi:hypothetical protein